MTTPRLKRHVPRELCRRCDYPITDGECRCRPLGACPFAPSRQCDCASTGVGCPDLKDQ